MENLLGNFIELKRAEEFSNRAIDKWSIGSLGELFFAILNECFKNSLACYNCSPRSILEI
jgi:hypothetical protein